MCQGQRRALNKATHFLPHVDLHSLQIREGWLFWEEFAGETCARPAEEPQKMDVPDFPVTNEQEGLSV